MHCRKETCSTGLFQEFIPAFPFGISKHPLPTRSRFLRATVGLTSSSAFFPSLHLQKKCTCLMQRSKPFGHAVVASSKTCYKCSDCALSCSVWLLQTISNQWTVVEIELLAFFATVGWKWGCQPFSCRCSLNVTHRRKETCSTGLFQEFIPAFPFGISKHPLPTRSILRATVGLTRSAFCLQHAHPFVASAEKMHLSHAKKQAVWSRSCGLVQDLLQWFFCAWAERARVSVGHWISYRFGRGQVH